LKRGEGRGVIAYWILVFGRFRDYLN